MHGMMNRALQCFLTDTYGRGHWDKIAQCVGIDRGGFEALLSYGANRTHQVLDAAVRQLGKPRDMLLEDLGTYLVSHPHMQVIRRLLRFGGPTYLEFLRSLDELPERARLAVPDLRLPMLELHEHDAAGFTLSVVHETEGFGHVMVGILRAMADDYGALVLLVHRGRRDAADILSIELADDAFAAGRTFHLAQRAP